MLQPSRPDSSPEINPLDAFELEVAENTADLNESTPTAPPRSRMPAAQETQRLAIAEAEIVKLRSEIATLVGVINDISRQLRVAHHAQEAAPKRHFKIVSHGMWRREFKPVPKRFGTAAVVGVILVGVIAGLTLGLMGWRAMTTVEVSDPPSIVAEPVEPVRAPEPPQTMASPPVPAPVPLKAAAIVTPVQDNPAPPITPRSYVGSLSIDAAPGGEVFVDRKSAGQTPIRLDNLRAGSHLIWIERDGYRRWTRVVQVPADQLSRVFADLEAIAER